MNRDLRSKFEEIAADAARAEQTRRLADEELALINQAKRPLIYQIIDEFIASMLELENTQTMLNDIYTRVKWATCNPSTLQAHLNKQKEG